MRRLAIILLLLAGCLHEAGAQERLDGASVKAVTTVRSEGDSVSLHMIRSCATAAEAVRTISGVQLRDYGGLGGLKTINVRSLGSAHVGVYVDGAPLRAVQNMQPDLGRIPMDGIGSVRLSDSPAGRRHLPGAGEYCSATSIHLDSRAPAPGPSADSLSVKLTGGYPLVSAVSMCHERKWNGNVSSRLSASGSATDGKFRFSPRDYDTTLVREGADMRYFQAQWQVFGQGKDILWDIKPAVYGSRRGVPGPVYRQASGYPLSRDRQDDFNASLQGRLTRHFGERFTAGAKARAEYDYMLFRDYPELFPERDGAAFRYIMKSIFISASGSYDISDHLRALLCADFSADALDASSYASAPLRLTTCAAGSLTASWPVLEASAGMGWNRIRDKSTLSTLSRHFCAPFISVSYFPSFLPGAKAGLLAKGSGREPSLNELYYTNAGSKALRPEKVSQLSFTASYSHTYDTGTRIETSAGAFCNSTRDKILAVPGGSLFRWSMYNIGKVSTSGCDLMARGSFKAAGARWFPEVRYSLQSAREEGLGQIPYIPLHSGSASLYATFRGWEAGLSAFFCGERFTSSANFAEYRLAPWHTEDVTISKSIPSRGISVSMAVRNILSRQYEIIAAYPMPGRSATVSVMKKF